MTTYCISFTEAQRLALLELLSQASPNRGAQYPEPLRYWIEGLTELKDLEAGQDPLEGPREIHDFTP